MLPAYCFAAGNGLTLLARQPHALNLALQVPHSLLQRLQGTGKS